MILTKIGTLGGVITCWIPTTDKYKSASLEYLVGSHNKKISQRRDKFYAKKDIDQSLRNI